MDRLTLISTFIRIADRGSISAAARDLGLSQASASRQLAQLEDRLGVPLILRTTHDLSLTETGRRVLARARGLLSEWESLVEDAREDPDAPLSGALRIVAPVALGQLHLTRAMLDFRAAHPDLSITWLLSDAEQRVAEAGLDLWIRIGQPLDEGLIVETVATVERLVVATSDRPFQKPSQFDLPLVALDMFEGGRIPMQSVAGQRATLNANVGMRVNDIFALREAVRAGAGAGVLPRWLIEEDLAAGRLFDLLPDWRAPELPITLSYLPALRTSRRLQAVRDAMRAAILAMPGINPAS